MASKKSNSGAGKVIATLAGITAAAVGAYYLYGHEEAKKNRARVRGWMLRAKGEVLDELEKAGEVTESLYGKTVDTVARKYRELKNIDPAELESFIEEMKEHWSGIKDTIGNRVGAKSKTKTTRTKKSSKK